MSRNVAAMMLWVLTALGAPSLYAHEIKPALLQLNQVGDNLFEVVWKRPVTGGRAVPLTLQFNHAPVPVNPTSQWVTPDAEITRWQQLALNPGETTLTIDGLENTISDVLVVLRFSNGNSSQTVLTPRQPSLVIEQGDATEAASAYLSLGIRHILGGADHLLFILGLLLLLHSPITLLKSITAFTVAHTITLALITLGHLRPNVPLVESLVALSIVFVAVEVIKAYRGEEGLMLRYPWILAFIFGLLHGSAFGGELINIGLPENHILWALLLFNTGIEIGQLLFIAAVVASYRITGISNRLPVGARWIPPYAIGSLGALWFLERLAGSLPPFANGYF